MLAKTLLTDTLAILLGLSSFTFYMAAFFYPEVHRRSDFLWSGLGMFYALVLWVCAGQMTGALLLGQMAAVALLLGLGWQTLTVRREKTPVYQQTPIVLTPEVVTGWAKNKVNQLRIAPAPAVPIRLEKRAERLDPRRRPAYDYEFVEDGIADEVTDNLMLTLEPEVEDTADGLKYVAPPSAEAKVIAVVEPEIDEPEIEEPDIEDSEATAFELEDAEAVAAKPEAVAETIEVEVDTQSAETEDVASEENAFEPAEALTDEASVAEMPESDQSDNWGDDWEETFGAGTSEVSDEGFSVARSAPKRPDTDPSAGSQRLAKTKPGLLATPLVLAEWVKDVVTSVTKPKPAKPVIEIPRREPPPSVRRETPEPAPNADVSASDMPDANVPQSDIGSDSGSETDADSNQWEESNWDD
ncbi:MAG: Ycf66 family protein [Phormidesmis sp.]